jgi:transcriptional regulator with XRE-family HTH domain
MARQGQSGDGADGWAEQLKAERLRVGLTQGELAFRAGLGEDTIRKYEAGKRRPSQETLERILAALQVDWGTSYRIMTARGFHHREVRFATEPEPAYYFTLPEVREFVERVPWPMFTGNELGEIAVANRAAQALWQVDLSGWLAGRTRASANLLVAMAEPSIVSRLANWEELLGHFVSVYKGVPAARAMLDDPGPLFEGILGALGDANPAFIGSLLRLWQTVPAREDKVRWMYSVVWREPGFPDIRFRGIVSQANERLSIGFNEWIPEDAASHAAYEAVLASRGGAARAGGGSTAGRQAARRRA